MRLLDLFCGAGGAAMGYYRAGFDEIVGVDIKPQPRYPFFFLQHDALTLLGDLIKGDVLVSENGKEFSIHCFDAIHASPPCQKYTCLNVMWNAKNHYDFVEQTRKTLKLTGLPYIIENVPGAPLTGPIKLCGSMFGLGAGPYDLRRHRLFECSFFVDQPKCNHIKGKPVIGIYGDHVRCRRRKGDLPIATGKPLANEAMGIDWMNWRELSQAIPPAYTEFIGKQLISYLRAKK